MTKLNSTEKLSQNTLDQIAAEITTELVKRGFHAPITLSQVKDRHGNNRITMKSAPFQTVPVIFKELTLGFFGGSVTQDKESDNILNIWLPVNVFYMHFSGGTNGADLFSFTCQAYTDDDFMIFGASAR